MRLTSNCYSNEIFCLIRENFLYKLFNSFSIVCFLRYNCELWTMLRVLEYVYYLREELKTLFCSNLIVLISLG